MFSDEDIENLLQLQYGNTYTFSLLSLLYPSLDFNNKFHIDHIFAKSIFTKSNLKNAGIAIENIDAFQIRYNLVANLQLLEAVPNMEKQAEGFDSWFAKTYKSVSEQKDYKMKHFIPENGSLNIKDFLEFYENRKLLLADKIREITKLE